MSAEAVQLRVTNYTIQFTKRAEKALGKFPARDAARIVNRIEEMEHGLAGDIKKLTDHSPEYRLRVGDYRVLFDLVGRTIVIQDVKPRKDAYD